MHYIFLDFEMNNHFTGKSESKIKGFNQEIIEIGAVKLNEEFQQIETFQMFIRPYAFNKLSPKVKNLTRIKGFSFSDENESLVLSKAIRKFNEEFLSNSEHYIIFTWGRDDRKVLIDNCRFNRVSLKYINWIYDSIDLQERFSDIYYNVFKRPQVGLNTALSYYRIDLLKRRHRAVNDSMYTSKVFIMMNKRLGIRNLVKAIESNDVYYKNKFKKEYLKIYKLLNL